MFYAVLDNNIQHNEGFVVSGRLFGSYNLKKDGVSNSLAFLRGRDVQLQGTRGGFGMYSLGVKKDLKDKRGSIGIGAENFSDRDSEIRSEQTANFQQKSLNVIHNMSFRINFSYRIGKMSVRKSAKQKNLSITMTLKMVVAMVTEEWKVAAVNNNERRAVVLGSSGDAKTAAAITAAQLIQPR